MAMKINAKVVGYGPDPDRTQALVNVIVEFRGPPQSMTLTVIVPNEGDEPALEEQGIAKAEPSGNSLTEARGRSAMRNRRNVYCCVEFPSIHLT
jgi:hypothetical protein